MAHTAQQVMMGPILVPQAPRFCAHTKQDGNGSNEHCQRVTCRDCGKVLLLIYPANINLRLAQRAIVKTGIPLDTPIPQSPKEKTKRTHATNTTQIYAFPTPTVTRTLLLQTVLIVLLTTILLLMIGIKYDLIIVVGLSNKESHGPGQLNPGQQLNPFKR